MPFNISLEEHQKTKMWTFRRTEEALELQRLLDNGDRRGYGKRLIELSKNNSDGKTHHFSRTKGVVYELFDEDETIDVDIKFQVKSSVITWSFIAQMDKTHQSFRDQVFNTAAKAHASVQNSCETYYRGTNHYHLKVMHSYNEESEFNHNHYRTADGEPITPVEVYEHIFAFYAQSEGRQFITTERERDNIILKFADFWADFNLDINYVPLSFIENGGGSRRVISQLEDIAREGKLSPDEADEKLENFFVSEHGKNMLGLAARQGFPSEQIEINGIKEFIKNSYRSIYSQMYFTPVLDNSLDDTMEPPSFSSRSSSSKSSPRDEYISSPTQTLDEIDELEYEAFASDLTKHCQSVNKELLEDLTIEDFRKGLLLYHALRSTQKEMKLLPHEGQRFHSDVTTDASIREMIKQLPSLQGGSTEDDLGGALLNKLLQWVTTASPKLDQWVEWVSVNGSRGLGSEIALVRVADGQVDLRQAVPQDDRAPGSNLAEIDFESVDLRPIFIPGAENIPSGDLTQADRLKNQLASEMMRLTNKQIAGNPSQSESKVFVAKMRVIEVALEVLSGKKDLADLATVIAQNSEWNSVSLGMKSKLEKYVNEVTEIGSPQSSNSKSEGFKL